MFFNTQKDREQEAVLLKRFVKCIDDMESYLDEYDEFIGLVSAEEKPMECARKLTYFFEKRLDCLLED